MSTRTVHDPFLGKDVEVSNNLIDRLRGKYASGPTMSNGEPEFGWRDFPAPPIQHEAAAAIDHLRALVEARRQTLALVGENLMKLDQRVLEQDAEIIRLGDLVERVAACVKKQAEDEGCWFKAETVTEAYLQRQLRLLHAAFEGTDFFGFPLDPSSSASSTDRE